jgi:UPF0271 protein
MIINCDIGERGADHPVDIELMQYAGIVNIACGGHAGDETSVKAFLKRARDSGIKISAHLSYPDKQNFGRKTISISDKELLKSLDSQYAKMPHIKTVKFHGALYNDANVNAKLARFLVKWMKKAGIEELITLADSKLATETVKAGLKVIPEAYAERNYAYNPYDKQLMLVSRTKEYAFIIDVDMAVKHATRIIKEGIVSAYIEDAEGKVTRIDVPIKADTICIHSDSKIAVELARKLAGLI